MDLVAIHTTTPAPKPFIGVLTRANRTIAATAAEFRVSVEDILGRSHRVDIVAVRHEAIRRVAAEQPFLSSPRLGRIFGRNHTTVLYALGLTKRAQERMRRHDPRPAPEPGATVPLEALRRVYGHHYRMRRAVLEVLVAIHPAGTTLATLERVLGRPAAATLRRLAEDLRRVGWTVIGEDGSWRLAAVEG